MGGKNLILLERDSHDQLTISALQIKVEVNLEPWRTTKGNEKGTCWFSSLALISLMCHLFPLIQQFRGI